MSVVISEDVAEVVTVTEITGDAYADSPYGSIIPGENIFHFLFYLHEI